VLEYLEAIKLPVESDEHLMQVALVSTNYDAALSKLIFDAIKAVGVEDLIEMEPGGRESFFTLTPASKLVRGYASEHFLSKGSSVAELLMPLVYISDEPLTLIKTLVPVLEYVSPQASFIQGTTPATALVCDRARHQRGCDVQPRVQQHQRNRAGTLRP
jgi:chaperonin GroEL